MARAPDVVHEKLSELVGDVAWGGLKELLRMAVATAITTLFANAVFRRTDRRWPELIRWLGAMTLLGFVMYYASDTALARSLAPVLFAPPPPPPPPPAPPLKALAMQTSRATHDVLLYCRSHPFRVAAIAGTLFLADVANLVVELDRLDPIVRIVQAVASPVTRTASALWRVALRRRAGSLKTLPAARHGGRLLRQLPSRAR